MALAFMQEGISIHALHEESDDATHFAIVDANVISIHALHEESDVPSGHLLQYVLFQSTLSMRRATQILFDDVDAADISIHALHEESDLILTLPIPAWVNFNPRSP